MKVILKENVKNLGMVGSVVDVKPGYARNFLVPHRLAEIATEGAIKNWQLGAERRQKRIEAELAEARSVAEKLAGVVLPFTKTVNGIWFCKQSRYFQSVDRLGPQNCQRLH